MNCFRTAADAHAWARSYGYSYSYRLVEIEGEYPLAVIWNYREPAGV